MTDRRTIMQSATMAIVAAPGMAPSPADGMGLSGLYAGSYLCQDGEHGVLLDIALHGRPNANGLHIAGALGFFPVLGDTGGDFSSVAGSVTREGLLTEEGRIVFHARDWLVLPDGYGAAHFNGNLAPRDGGLWQITGTPVAGGQPGLPVGSDRHQDHALDPHAGRRPAVAAIDIPGVAGHLHLKRHRQRVGDAHVAFRTIARDTRGTIVAYARALPGASTALGESPRALELWE